MNEKNPFDSIPEDPNFVLVNPDEPDVNPQVWSETKGGTEGVFTGEKKSPKKKNLRLGPRRPTHPTSRSAFWRWLWSWR